MAAHSPARAGLGPRRALRPPGRRALSATLLVLLLVAVSLLGAACGRGQGRLARRGGETPAPATTTAASAQSILVDGRTRTFRLHVPASLGAGPAPLVLVFHGRGGSGARMEDTTRFGRLADRDGFIVAFPDGYERSWNDGRGSASAERAGVDDVAFARVLIDHLARTYPVDGGRIYAAGFSNGASLTHRLGCELSDRLAAIATVAGQISPAVAGRCQPVRPMGVLGLHGLADALNAWDGRDPGRGPDRGPLLSVPATMELWRRHGGCQAPGPREPLPAPVNDGTRPWQQRYPGCAEGVTVVLYGVDGMGHAWPPQTPVFERISGPASGNLDATEVIWGFFKGHPPRPRRASSAPARPPGVGDLRAVWEARHAAA